MFIMSIKSKLQTTLISTAAGVSLVSAQPLLQFGDGMSVHGLLSSELVFEDNIFLDHTNEENDMILRITPGLEFNLAREGAASVSLKYEHIFQYYDDWSRLDRDLSRLSFGMRYDSGVILAALNASFNEFSSNEPDINTRGQLIDRDVTSVNGSLKYGISRLLAVSVGGAYSKTDFDQDTYTESESFAVPLTVFYNIRPNVDLTAGIRYRETETSDGFGMSQDYEDLYYYVGAVGELFSPVLTADIKVGYQDRDYKNSSRSVGTPTYSLSLIYSGDPKTTFSASISRDYKVSAIGFGTYATSIATLAAQYQVNHRVSLASSVNFGKNEYEDSPRSEDIFVYTLGGTYRANDFFSVHAGYEYHNIDGEGYFGVNSYKLNKFKVAASLRY